MNQIQLHDLSIVRTFEQLAALYAERDPDWWLAELSRRRRDDPEWQRAWNVANAAAGRQAA